MSTAAGRHRFDAAGHAAGGYLPTLDGWRGLAILWVVVFHDHPGLFGPSGVLPSDVLSGIARSGGLGVDLFFGISGFLIGTRLLLERERSGGVDLPRFFLRRAFRILPPYLVYLAAVATLALGGLIPTGLREYVSCLVFARDYYPTVESLGWYTAHLWSLSVEEHFYLLAPFLIAFASNRRARQIALGIGLVVPIWQALDSRLGLLSTVGTLSLAGNRYRTDTRIGGLFLGFWFALLYHVPAIRAVLRRTLGGKGWTLALAIGLAVAFAPVRWPLVPLWIALIAPCLIVGTALHPSSPVGRMLEWGPLRAVGRISYGLYLWQQLFFVTAGNVAPLGAWQRFPLNWVGAFGCAVASQFLIERPGIALGKRLASRDDSTTPGRRVRTTRDRSTRPDVPGGSGLKPDVA